MPELAKTTVMAAGLASTCLAGISFAPSSPLSSAVQPRAQGPSARGARMESGRGAGAAAPLAVAGVLGVAFAAVGRPRGRASRVPTNAKVLTKDEAGRFRFDVEKPVLVPAEQPGVTAPLGFFDPLGFTRDPLMTFANDPNGFKHLREAEIKHGRVAMMAATGSVVAHYVKMPGFEGVPTGLAALGTSAGTTGFAVLLLLAGVLEAARGTRPADQPGSYGDPFGFGQYTEEMRTKELNNGRMAMFAVTGQLAAELVTGVGPVQQLGL